MKGTGIRISDAYIMQLFLIIAIIILHLCPFFKNRCKWAQLSLNLQYLVSGNKLRQNFLLRNHYWMYMYFIDLFNHIYTYIKYMKRCKSIYDIWTSLYTLYMSIGKYRFEVSQVHFFTRCSLVVLFYFWSGSLWWPLKQLYIIDDKSLLQLWWVRTYCCVLVLCKYYMYKNVCSKLMSCIYNDQGLMKVLLNVCLMLIILRLNIHVLFFLSNLTKVISKT